MPVCNLVIGSSGGIGAALAEALAEREPGVETLRWSRSETPGFDLLDEGSIEDLAGDLGGADLGVVIDATGFLHGEGFMPEKSWRELDAAHLAHVYAVNTIGPALLMKHILPRLPRKSRSVFATLSARVGSISDNRLGGWHAYRASKAALNQLVRCNAIELARRAPEAICVAVHPGTVSTRLSEPFAKSGLDVRDPEIAAGQILDVIDSLGSADTGGFFDHKGAAIPF